MHVLPALATAAQMGEFLQVSPRQIHYWAASKTIPTALRQGKVIRFDPRHVLRALGIPALAGAAPVGSDGQEGSATVTP